MQRVLEIGCGDRLTVKEGWDHLDVRKLPHIEFVQDARNLGNIEAETYDRVIAVNILEHISWREVLRVLVEWFRVVKPDGVLEIEVPNALELAEILTDEDYSNGLVETRFQLFNRVCFGHQDYPENTHLSYFTECWLRELLFDAGASDVTVLFSNGRSFRLEATKGT